MLIKALYQTILKVLIIDEYSKTYQNFLVLGDFNNSINEKRMSKFCNLNGLTSLIKRNNNIFQESLQADMHRSQPSCFQHSKIFETGLSDFHLLAVIEFKTGLKRAKYLKIWAKMYEIGKYFQKGQMIACDNRITTRIGPGDYKHFDNEQFRSDIGK